MYINELIKTLVDIAIEQGNIPVCIDMDDKALIRIQRIYLAMTNEKRCWVALCHTMDDRVRSKETEKE